MISVRGLQKIYRVHRREPGFVASVSSLFRRKYDDVRAVDGIDFEIEPGERVGFLGPNGAPGSQKIVQIVRIRTVLRINER